VLRRDPLTDLEPLVHRVYAYVAYRLGDGPDAEDVMSEVFERALRYRESYDSTRGEPINWLIGIARRCIANANWQPTEEVESVEVADPYDLAVEAVERMALLRAVALLPERDRDLIALRYGADLKARQIAGLYETTTNSVEVALHRALSRLRALLAEGDPESSAPTLKPSPRRV
jgi:RNA polymerase sigma factor (sigma-70 family)